MGGERLVALPHHVLLPLSSPPPPPLQAVGNITWALAVLKYYDAPVMDAAVKWWMHKLDNRRLCSETSSQVCVVWGWGGEGRLRLMGWCT